MGGEIGVLLSPPLLSPYHDVVSLDLDLFARQFFAFQFQTFLFVWRKVRQRKKKEKKETFVSTKQAKKNVPNCNSANNQQRFAQGHPSGLPGQQNNIKEGPDNVFTIGQRSYQDTVKRKGAISGPLIAFFYQQFLYLLPRSQIVFFFLFFFLANLPHLKKKGLAVVASKKSSFADPLPKRETVSPT